MAVFRGGMRARRALRKACARPAGRPPRQPARRAVLLGSAALAGASALTAGAAVAVTPGTWPPGDLAAGAASALPAGARLLGPVPAAQRIRVTLALRSRDPGGLARMAQAVSSPGSGQYRRFLLPGQVTARFGAPPAAIAYLRSWLRGFGITAGPTLGDGLLLPAHGPAGQLARAFRTTIRLVRLPGGRVARVSTRPATVPARARRLVLAVAGLDTVLSPRPGIDHGPAGRPAHGPADAPARHDAGGIPRACRAARRTPATFTAGQLAHAYGLGTLYRRGFLGHGVTVALFELADFASRDISTYTRCYGIRPVIRRVRVDGGTTVRASGPAIEEITADIETVAGLAPRARVLVYEAPGGGFASVLDNYGAILQQDRAQVVSSSYGYCEPVLAAAGRGIIDAEAGIFAGMAVQGQSMLAASGDAGSEQCLPFLSSLHARAYQLAVGDPASQPFVTGVGGTAIVRYGSPPVQAAWNQTGPRADGSGFPAPFDGRHGRPAGYPGNLAGDGGISARWRMPGWQRGFDRSGNSSGLPCGARRGGLCREVPDVSALAAAQSPATPGYAVYGTAGAFRGAGWQSVGGTSLATPLWAAFAALADQQVRPRRLGLLTPALYLTDRRDPAAFTDVTAGGNDYLARAGQPSRDTCRDGGRRRLPCYLATAGYDMATGLGSPAGGRLAADLARWAQAARSARHLARRP